MSRLAIILAALHLANPQLSKPVQRNLAHAISIEAERAHIDPLLMISVFWHESGVRAGAVSKDGEDYGLGQIRARYIGACRKDADPVNHPSQACLAVKSSLLNPNYNVRTTAQVIAKWRTTCREATGTKALAHRWLSGYAGESRPPLTLCGQQKQGGRWRGLPQSSRVRSILSRYKRLLRLR